MLVDFDLRERPSLLTTMHFVSDGTQHITLTNYVTQQVINQFGVEFAPLGPRLSPHGHFIAFFSNENGLYVYDIERDKLENIFDDPHLKTGFCEWSSDGEQLCFSAYAIGADERTPPNIYTVHVRNKSVRQHTTDANGVDRFPQWAPNARHIAFCRQHLNDPDTRRHMHVLDTQTNRIQAIPNDANTHQCIGRYCWSMDSTRLLIQQSIDDLPTIRIIRIADLTVEWERAVPNLVGACFTRENDIFVVTKSELHLPTENELQWMTAADAISVRTSLPTAKPIKQTLRGPAICLAPSNASIYILSEDSTIYRWHAQKKDEKNDFEIVCEPPEEDPLPVYKHETYAVRSFDGYRAPVHRFTPESPKSIGVVLIHGGPGERVDDPHDSISRRLLSAGYELIVPAYRGCDGYGKAHKEANRGEYGRADVWDIIAAANDWKRRTKGDRPLAIMGYSYGGFLTFLTLANTDDLFSCGITLWGVTQVENMGLHLHRAYPTDADERASAQIERNPLHRAKDIQTPLLILHGNKDTGATDAEVAAIQRQVRLHGGTCDLVQYADGDHGLHRHRDDMFAQIFNMLDSFD